MFTEAVRTGYESLGIDGYYLNHCDDYKNPHFEIIKTLLIEYIQENDIGNNILDLCCGSGEITTILEEKGNYNIEGIDPYTCKLYENNTNKKCYQYSFKDIVNGFLDNKKYDTIICSFAMHLCDISMLDTLLYQLSRICKKLIIITPNKRPEIKNWFELREEKIYERVRLRVYKNKCLAI